MQKVLTAIVPLLLSSLMVAGAQVSVSPLYERLELTETGQVQATFSVTNGSPEAVRFRASFLPFRFGEASIELIEDGNVVEGDLSPYLRAAPLEFEVPPSGEQVVRVIALVPPSAIETELRAALVVEPLVDTTTPLEEAGEDVTGRVLYTYRFIAQLYASQSDVQAALSIENPVYTPESGLSLVYANGGSVSGIGNTTWQLKRGEEVVLASEEAERFIVLPGDTRNGVLAENLRLAPGDYTLTGIFGVEDGGEPPVVLNPQPFTQGFTVE